jgi:hypothetical protein
MIRTSLPIVMVLLAAAPALAAETKTERPNILLIITDQQHANMLG